MKIYLTIKAELDLFTIVLAFFFLTLLNLLQIFRTLLVRLLQAFSAVLTDYSAVLTEL
jgi:hypothetical protein